MNAKLINNRNKYFSTLNEFCTLFNSKLNIALNKNEDAKGKYN